MRVVIDGAGAIGGVVGGRLYAAGHDVTLIARGAHLEAMARDGLVLEEPGSTRTLDVEVVADPAAIGSWDGAVVLLAVKSQDTQGALEDLARWAPESTTVACLQNGVENERMALRMFPGVIGACVMCAATHVRPGVVQAHSSPVVGLVDIGLFPSGRDGRCDELAEALGSAGFDAVVRTDVMAWKYGKLLVNLANAVEVLCGPGTGASDLTQVARAEGRSVLAAAGISVTTPEEEKERRRVLTGNRPTASGPHSGGSSWQSAIRGSRTTEAPYLNGEIVLLGRLHGIPTPVNETIVRLAGDLVRRGGNPGAMDPDGVLAAAAAGPGPR